MKELNLEEIKSIQINILTYFDEFCKKNGIEYFLCNGSLLGAVKYNGYIPWDDDIDVCLLRSEYEKLISLYDNSQNRYSLFSFEKEKKFLFPFSKLSDTNTILYEGCVNNGVELGVNIDIFPIDGFGDCFNEAKKNARKAEKIRRRLYYSKINIKDSNFFILKKLLLFCRTIFYKIIGSKFYCKKLIDLAKNNGKSFIGNFVWGFYGEGEAFNPKVFSGKTYKEFENILFPIPVCFDEYLKGLYGDYKKDLPADEQRSHHIFKVYYK